MPRPMYLASFTSPKQSILPSPAKVDTFPALAQAFPTIFLFQGLSLNAPAQGTQEVLF